MEQKPLTMETLAWMLHEKIKRFGSSAADSWIVSSNRPLPTLKKKLFGYRVFWKDERDMPGNRICFGNCFGFIEVEISE